MIANCRTSGDYIGARYVGGGRSQFSVWAPAADHVDVHIVSPHERILSLVKEPDGYHRACVEGLAPGSLYLYRLDDQSEYPDPASCSQPQGVHGPSEVLDDEFPWENGRWRGVALDDYVLYELHIGTFTKEGTFAAVIPFIRQLKDLGITALELMPVAQFPGTRNWGYDAVYPFAVQAFYGGAAGLKALINECHKEGMSVVLDVVYNHLGPEGNYFEKFGHYFTDRYHTPWGKAINFDGPYSDEVRRFFLENAAYWFTKFHADALRLDALHAVFDFSPRHFLEDLAALVKKLRVSLNRELYLIGESNANDRRLLISLERGGYGLDAQWHDDFHHALHVLLTGERSAYYEDFGQVEQLAGAFREGFIYTGQYSSFRKRRHGSPSKDIEADKFVVFAQNHDQVGNRRLGTRLSQIVPFAKLKIAAGVVLLSPFIPLIFMGEEYGETAPFQYFISHSDPELVAAVREGRREEFAAFHQGKVPDPQAEATFMHSKLNHDLMGEGNHRVLLSYYKELLRLRREVAALRKLSKKDLECRVFEGSKLLYLHRWADNSEAVLIVNFAEDSVTFKVPFPQGYWRKSLDSLDTRWLGGRSGLPDEFQSNGERAMTFPENSLVLFTLRKEA
jgi:maltooligosyltrehalose trehalohydrolase